MSMGFRAGGGSPWGLRPHHPSCRRWLCSCSAFHYVSKGEGYVPGVHRVTGRLVEQHAVSLMDLSGYDGAAEPRL